MTHKDYYRILGISPQESSRGIRHAFRSLAKRHHPDKAGPEGNAYLKDILEAYHTLSDPEKRRRYDDALGNRAPSGDQYRGTGSRTFSGRAGRSPAFRDFSRDLFDEIFRRPSHIDLEAVLSSEEAARGVSEIVSVPVPTGSPARGGSGFGLFGCPWGRTGSPAEAAVTVRITIPPAAHDGMILEFPIQDRSLSPLRLRLHIKVR